VTEERQRARGTAGNHAPRFTENGDAPGIPELDGGASTLLIWGGILLGMRSRFAPAVGAIVAASCFVPIDDVQPKGTATGGSGGTAGTSDASSGGSGGASGGAGGVGGSVGGGAGGAGAAAGTASGGAGGGAGGFAGDCLLPLSDDFADGVFDSIWSPSAENGMQVAETGGVLRFTFPATPVQTGYAGIGSKSQYDLTGCSVLMQVVDVPNTSTHGYLHFAVDAGSGNVFEYHIGGGGISAVIWLAGVEESRNLETFSLSKHTWLRLAESGGVLLWEASGDGKSWTLFASAASKFSIKAIRVKIGAGMWKVESSSPGTTAADDLNLPPKP
jgi:hypothetical protein